MCTATLAKDRLQILKTDHQRYAYLNRIDQETFDRLKQDVEGGLSIPVVDLFITPSASFGEFVDRREKFFQEINYTTDLGYEAERLELVTDPIEYTAWAACMSEFAKRNVGFFAWKKADRPGVMVVDYYWNAPVGAESARAVSEIKRGSVKNMPKGQAFPRGKVFRPNEGGTLEIHHSGRPSSLVATLGAEGYTTAALLSVYRLGDPIGTAFVRLGFETERRVGPMETGATSGNNSNIPCGDAPNCSPDRKWRASVISLTLDAGEGRVLRGAHVTCVGMPPDLRATVDELKRGKSPHREIAGSYAWAYVNACASSRVTQAPVNGGRIVNAQVLSWTRPTYFVLRATAVEPESTVDTTRRVTLEPSLTFVVPVPPGASTAVIFARACGRESAATPGQSSPDKRLVYLGQAEVGDDIAYRYKYDPPRGPDGRLIRACELPGVTGVNAVVAAARFNERYDLERRRH